MKTQNIRRGRHDSTKPRAKMTTTNRLKQIASLRLPKHEHISPWIAESAVAWKLAIERKDGFCAYLLSSKLHNKIVTLEQVANIAKGGYILKDCEGKPELILIATGSEVELAVSAAAELTAEGKESTRSIYACNWRIRKQDAEYREVCRLPSDVGAIVSQ